MRPRPCRRGVMMMSAAARPGRVASRRARPGATADCRVLKRAVRRRQTSQDLQKTRAA
ncbi:hypothetical protein [Lysobacter gummosus]|uniref:hypothetical protein n=1 Tax=Lysobacter gummosus TaxID=262324 RepID=UPI00363B1E8E